MSATGLDAFDKTLQTTNVWLKEICEEVGPDRQIAWHVLGTGLRALRDRLQPELAAHLAAELPLLVRGAYYDRYRPSEQPRLTRSREEFVKSVESELQDIRPVDPELAIQSVFGVLDRHIPPGPDPEAARRAAGRCARALAAVEGRTAQAQGGTRDVAPAMSGDAGILDD